MNYIGKWVFHSVMSMDENYERVYLTAEEYLNSPMDYVDTTAPDAVADEMRQRKSITEAVIKVCEDGKLYMLMPMAEGVSKDEIGAAVSAGEVSLIDGMICEKPLSWELRDDELWYDTGIEGEVFGDAAETWVKAVDDDGFLNFITFRFAKAE